MSPVSRAKLSPSCQASNWPVIPQASRARQLSNVGVIVQRRRGSFHLAKGRWGWVNDLGGNGSDMSEKKYRCRSYTPRKTSPGHPRTSMSKETPLECSAMAYSSSEARWKQFL